MTTVRRNAKSRFGKIREGAFLLLKDHTHNICQIIFCYILLNQTLIMADYSLEFHRIAIQNSY